MCGPIVAGPTTAKQIIFKLLVKCHRNTGGFDWLHIEQMCQVCHMQRCLRVSTIDNSIPLIDHMRWVISPLVRTEVKPVEVKPVRTKSGHATTSPIKSCYLSCYAKIELWAAAPFTWIVIRNFCWTKRFHCTSMCDRCETIFARSIANHWPWFLYQNESVNPDDDYDTLSSVVRCARARFNFDNYLQSGVWTGELNGRPVIRWYFAVFLRSFRRAMCSGGIAIAFICAWDAFFCARLMWNAHKVSYKMLAQQNHITAKVHCGSVAGRIRIIVWHTHSMNLRDTKAECMCNKKSGHRNGMAREYGKTMWNGKH